MFGPSGSGKSTLLRLIAGLLPQHSGVCQLHGRELRGMPPHRRRVVLVEQSPALFPNLNVEENITFARRSVFGRRDVEERRATDALLEDFQLGPLRGAAVHTLSGGERQRVAIARALYAEPKALLLDEVFTGMDAALRESLIAVLRRYQQRTGVPILSVTHDVGEAFATATELLRMRDGAVVAQGPPEQVLQAERSELLRSLAATQDVA
ncbi:ABC transporter ATP-binding protein [Terriglobus aquaticus]|uniref:ABC transporter ATP-binding protein n=1 Tax=Terriglobus aquaticus TaxID=940139 RepID=A0ABW9KIG6_9BACT|nr:ABC transporter ATP-binding protein [Terriglobus aquaticus]